MTIGDCRTRRKENVARLAEEKVSSLDSLSVCMKSHMLSNIELPMILPSALNRGYLNDEIVRDLKGKDIPLDRYTSDTVATPINMMCPTCWVWLRYHPRSNVSIFSPTQQECLLYAYKENVSIGSNKLSDHWPY